MVAALEGAARGGRRARRRALPRPADRDAVVAGGPEPAYLEGESYARARDAVARLKGDRHLRRGEDSPSDSLADRVTREAIWRLVTPRWRRHLERLVERERPDAVIVFTVPMAHFRGIPEALRERFGLPVVFYDGDVPMSLPEFGGMDTGFNYYHGADPGEYDLVVSNSEGGSAALLELGARRAETIFWGADPEFFAPLPVEKEHDVFFYGYGDKFRREWMSALVGEPSRRLADVDFALGGHDFRGDTGQARLIGDVPFPSFPRAISAARINLCLTRRPHATVYASSSCRPFELAAAAAAIVANPYDGIERWFEPGASCSSSPTPTRRSPPTVPCSTIPGRPRRWAGARASACSTSTPTATAPAGCSSCSAWGCPRVSTEVELPEAGAAPVGASGPLAAVRRIAIVPAYNEERNIARLLDELRLLDPGLEVVVVSDGSTDRTAEVAAAGGAHVVRLPFNLGIGGAVQTGFRFAWERGYELAVRLDGDGQHDPAELRAVVAPVVAGEADISIGSRFLGGGGYRSSAARRVGIRVLARVVSWIARERLTDTTSGFQALNRRAIALFAADLPHDYPEVEGLVMAIRHGLRVQEVPVTMRERAHGRSSIGTLASVYYMIKVLLAIFVDLFRRDVVPLEEA